MKMLRGNQTIWIHDVSGPSASNESLACFYRQQGQASRSTLKKLPLSALPVDNTLDRKKSDSLGSPSQHLLGMQEGALPELRCRNGLSRGEHEEMQALTVRTPNALGCWSMLLQRLVQWREDGRNASPLLS